MSHFVAIAILPPGTEPEGAEDRIGALFAPYDENREVEAHEGGCECVGLDAHLATNAQVRREFDAELAELRSRSADAYATDHPEVDNHGIHPSLREAWDALWRRREARTAKLEARHPAAGKSDSACEDCGGTGTVTTTTNESGVEVTWCPGSNLATNHGQGDQAGEPAGDEVLPSVRTDQGAGGVHAGDQKPGREVHLLPPLPESAQRHEDQGAATPVVLPDDAGGVRAADGDGRVRDLRHDAEWGRALVGGGPLSPDGARAWLALHAVQHVAGPDRREVRLARCGSGVPHEAHETGRRAVGGRWDWWQIGGRWTAFFAVPDADGDEYDPVMDPRNQERCLHCAPHPGKRFWRDVPRDADSVPSILTGYGDTMTVPATSGEPGAREVDCNACSGTGVACKWPTQWAEVDSNYAPVERWAALLGADADRYAPYAVVTADGRWHDQGDDWTGAVRALAAAAEPGSLVAVVDCHS